MKIFEEGENVRLQLMDLNKGKWLFNFTVDKSTYPELKAHMIEHLEKFKLGE